MGSGSSVPIVQFSKERIVIVTGATSELTTTALPLYNDTQLETKIVYVVGGSRYREGNWLTFANSLNPGTGYEIAKWTAMMGATVILACRSEEKTRHAIHRMNAEFIAEKSRGTKGLTDSDELNVEFMKLELGSFKSVVQFVENFKKSYNQLHVLFCNAGLGLTPYVKTEDGLEMNLQVNYLSHFLLTAKLLPMIKESGPDCRILNMTSMAHSSAPFDIDTINYTGPPGSFPSLNYYTRSKLYQVMQMFSMVQRLQGTNISVNCIHPGVVNSGFGHEAEDCFFRCYNCCIMPCISKSPEKAAKCSIDCVVNPKLAGVTGVYFDDFKQKSPGIKSRNEQYQETLWKKTFEFIGEYLTDDKKLSMEGRK